MIRKTFLILSISLFAILAAVSCSRSQQYYDDGISDEEYIRVASETEEAKAFLERFPSAEVLVDRSGELAVDYRITQVQPATTEQSWEGVRLRVFIDPESKRAEDTIIQCSDQSGTNFVEEDLIEYLEQYGQSQSCP
ncbi:MAG: hypothetical protein ACYC3H_08635 [Bellilinea sp.]